MSRIRSSNTSPELALRGCLHARGHRYQLQRRLPFGRPDLVFTRQKIAVFIDGCFWHGCPADYVAPKSRREFWAEKLRTNVERDRRQTAQAEQAGWRAVRIWEHEIRDDVASAADLVAAELEGKGRVRQHWQVLYVETLGGQECRALLELRDQGSQPRLVEAPCDAHGLRVIRRS